MSVYTILPDRVCVSDPQFVLHFLLLYRWLCLVCSLSHVHPAVLPRCHDPRLRGGAGCQRGPRVPVDRPHTNPTSVQRSPAATHLSHVRYKQGAEDERVYIDTVTFKLLGVINLMINVNTVRFGVTCCSILLAKFRIQPMNNRFTFSSVLHLRG